MPQPRPLARDLARAVVGAHATREGPRLELLMGNLAVTLGKLIGPSGFDVLFARAVTLAAREDAVLAGAHSAAGGRLEGLPEPVDERSRCTLLILSHLLELLMKFIGEDLAARVVRDALPVAANDGETRETK